MSTTFEVYPGIKQIPTFQEIIDLSTKRLHKRLKEVHIYIKPDITVHFHFTDPEKSNPVDMMASSSWENIAYAFFSVGNIPGGTDTYFRTVEQLDWDCWGDHIAQEHSQLEKRAPTIRSCLENGHYWYFRRSSGQPSIINLTYGLMAASLAELTNGYIYSADSAWDYERFPATYKEFDAFYFRPEKTLSKGTKSWSKECLGHLPDEFIKNYPENTLPLNLRLRMLIAKWKK